ncbi:hypothetical protein [Halosimplex sp. J119]
MSDSLHRSSPSGRPTVAEYVALAALLAGLVLVRLGITVSASAFRPRGGILGIPLVVITVYSLVVLAGLGAVYAVYAAGREDRLDGFELVEAGLAAAAFVFVAVHLALDRFASGVSAEPVILPGGYAVALGLLAVGYARVADLDLPTTPPTRDGWLATGGAVGVVAVATAVVTAGATLVGWPDSLGVAFRYGTMPDVSSFLLSTVVPAVLTAVGTALLFNGAIQTALRRHRSSAAAAGAVALLAFGADWVIAVASATFSPILAPLPGALRWVGLVVALVLTVVAVLAAALGYGRLWDARTPLPDDDRALFVAAGAGATLAVVVPLVASAFVSGGAGPSTLSYAVAVATAAVATERTRSVWAPAVVYAVHGVAIELVSYYVLSGGAGEGAVTVVPVLV